MDAEMRDFVLDLQKKAKRMTEGYIRLAESKFGRDFPVPLVLFNDLGTTAGRCWTNGHPQYGGGTPVIEYNPRILRLNHEDFLHSTTGHEVAHMIAVRLHASRIDPHGAEWARVMWAFSLPAERCHNYDTGLGGTVHKRAVAYSTQDGKNVVERRGAKVITFD